MKEAHWVHVAFTFNPQMGFPMKIKICFSGGKRSDFGNHDYEQVLTSSFDRFEDRLNLVYLYIQDINGPRGGVDKQCRCVLHLRRMPPIVIQDQDESMTALIQRVASRAAYVLSQKTDRRNKRFKRSRLQEELVAAADE